MRAISSGWLIHPDNNILKTWDMFITLLLILTCMSTPLHLAFFEDNSFFAGSSEDNSNWWHIYNYICDGLFLLDIIICFNTKYLDEDL